MDFANAVGKRLRIHLSAGQREAFDVYYQELVSIRGRVNLTSLRDRESIERRHFLESLALLKAIEDAGTLASPVIDLGSGAGFPGVPMKIVRPELQMTLLEATEKKAAFLRALVERLSLQEVQVINRRAEEASARPGASRRLCGRGGASYRAAPDVGGARATVRANRGISGCPERERSGTRSA